jgi:hypothetical protein
MGLAISSHTVIVLSGISLVNDQIRVLKMGILRRERGLALP